MDEFNWFSFFFYLNTKQHGISEERTSAGWSSNRFVYLDYYDI